MLFLQLESQLLTKECINYPTPPIGHNDVFFGVIGGRAPCFSDLSVGGPQLPLAGECGGGKECPRR